ncbi:MAG: hypothetical protein Kow0031_07650 [Anaerolineae bacterium]
MDGPTPDWMKMATASSNQPTLTEENTPDWLKDIQGGRTVASESTTPAPAEDDEMSDLERLLAEEGIDLNSVEDDVPPEAAGMSARDWMIATSDDEVIRKRIGDSTFGIEPAAAEPALDGGDDDPFAGMSDLERLLAEEGVDLSSVEDDVPPEAAGMSARDWMISTSDDEMIRKRIGATSFGEQEPEAALGAETPEPEAPAGADEDLPDWLQEIQDEPELEVAEALVVEDDLPDWLQDEDETAEVIAAAEDDMMVVEEDLPDWLQDVEEAEPTFEPALASTAEDDKMVVEEDLPDWLRDVAEDEVVAEAAGEPGQAEDEDGLPDWLRDVEDEVAAEVEAEPVAVAESAAEDDMMVVEEDLPDWLRDVAEEEPAGEAEEAVAALAEDDKMVVEEDLPDWLRDVEEDEEPAAVAETPVAVDEEDLPDWLQEVQEETELAVAPAVAATEALPLSGDDNIIDEEDLPDWLRDVEVDTEEPELEGVVDELFAEDTGEDLPEWLTEVQSQADEAFEPSEPAPLEPAEMGEEDLPDWLQEVETEAEPLLEEEKAIEELVAETALADDGLIDEEGLPDWLQDVGAEPEPVAQAEPIEPEPEPEPEPVAVAPPPRPVPPPAPPKVAAPGGMPDWLRKLREGDQEPQPAAPPTPAPVPVPVAAAVAPVAPPPPAPAPPPQPAPAPVVAGVQPVAVHAPATQPPAFDLPAHPDERLKLAQAARDDGDIDKATHIYEALVNSGAHLDTVINDIELVIRSFPSNFRLYQIKGDAMMRDGRLQGALDSYRKALERLPT